MTTPLGTRITATPAARQAIARLRAARGETVMFVQSGGCCAGSTPMCYADGEFVIGDIDVLLGDIAGCPFYIDRRLDEAWHQDQFILDVAPGEPEDSPSRPGTTCTSSPDHRPARHRAPRRPDFSAFFFPVTDTSFDTDSYHQFAEGYFLRRDAMQWFWDQYTTDPAQRAEITASPLRASSTNWPAYRQRS